MDWTHLSHQLRAHQLSEVCLTEKVSTLQKKFTKQVYIYTLWSENQAPLDASRMPITWCNHHLFTLLECTEYWVDRVKNVNHLTNYIIFHCCCRATLRIRYYGSEPISGEDTRRSNSNSEHSNSNNLGLLWSCAGR